MAFNDDMASLYDCYKYAAKSGDELDSMVLANAKQRYGSVYEAGSVGGSGAKSVGRNPDSIFREATEEHEGVHTVTYSQGIKQFGGETADFARWWNDPVNWGNDEMAAYGAANRYLQMSLDWL